MHPPSRAETGYIFSRGTLSTRLSKGVITPAEFEEKKRALLARI